MINESVSVLKLKVNVFLKKDDLMRQKATLLASDAGKLDGFAGFGRDALLQLETLMISYKGARINWPWVQPAYAKTTQAIQSPDKWPVLAFLYAAFTCSGSKVIDPMGKLRPP